MIPDILQVPIFDILVPIQFGIYIQCPISIADVQYTMSDFIWLGLELGIWLAKARTRARARDRTGTRTRARARAMEPVEICSKHCIKVSDISMSFRMKQYLIDNLFDGTACYATSEFC